MLSELSTFQFDGLSPFTGREMYSAQWKKRDDRVIAYCLAMYAVRQSPKHYADMMDHQHAMPTAVELRLNRSPQIEASRLPKGFMDQLPVELKNIFDGGFDPGIVANPIRGYMDVLR